MWLCVHYRGTKWPYFAGVVTVKMTAWASVRCVCVWERANPSNNIQTRHTFHMTHLFGHMNDKLFSTLWHEKYINMEGMLRYFHANSCQHQANKKSAWSRISWIYTLEWSVSGTSTISVKAVTPIPDYSSHVTKTYWRSTLEHCLVCLPQIRVRQVDNTLCHVSA